LVILRGSAEEAFMLSHQAFIQFLRSFIPNPPTWIREGFAIYFNTLRFDPVMETLHYEENLTWLDAVKNLGQRILRPRDIILADTVQSHDAVPGSGTANGGGRYSRDFQICSWALVSFFLNSGDHFRSLTECFMVLSPESSAIENSFAVMHRLSLWINFDELDREFLSYIDSRKTFTELMENGLAAYTAGDLMTAEFSFLAAQFQQPAHYGPYYYLALIYYQEGLHEMAEDNYHLSLEYGADEALVYFALGANAISAGRIGDARTWLEKAAFKPRAGND
jgi:tetratricopeptide (TPR) repeat protein